MYRITPLTSESFISYTDVTTGSTESVSVALVLCLAVLGSIRFRAKCTKPHSRELCGIRELTEGL